MRVIVVVARLIVVVSLRVVVAGGEAVISYIRRYRKDPSGRVLGDELGFMVEKLLMNLCKRRKILAIFNMMFDRLVFVR